MKTKDDKLEMQGYSIDAENPVMHSKPEICSTCGVISYFGGHYCIGEKSKAKKRARRGYYDGK